MYLREPVRPVSWYVPSGSLSLHKKIDVFSNVKSNIFWFKISVYDIVFMKMYHGSRNVVGSHQPFSNAVFHFFLGFAR